MPFEHPLNGFALSRNELRKQMGNSPLYQYLQRLASDDVCLLNNIPGINNFPIAMGAYWTPANSGGTSVANFATVVGAGPGYIQGDTGTSDNGSISLIGPVIYQGDLNAGLMFDFQIDDVTNYKLEMGLIDAVPGSNASGVTDPDTPTVVMADGAVMHINTDETVDLAFVTEGSTASMDPQATAFTTTTNLTAATRHRLVIQTVGNFAYCILDGKLEAVHDAAKDSAGCLEGGTLLAPWIWCATANTTAKFPRLYNFAIWQDWR